MTPSLQTLQPAFYSIIFEPECYNIKVDPCHHGMSRPPVTE